MINVLKDYCRVSCIIIVICLCNIPISQQTYAVDCNTDCNRHCKNVFIKGGCITACEAEKAISRNSGCGGVVLTPSNPDFDKTISSWLRQGLTPPMVREYFVYLERQGDGTWKRLPQRLHEILIFEYVKSNLRSVKYAESVNTVHGQHITVGDNIYFIRPINLNYCNLNEVKVDKECDLHLLLHELEHTSQYAVHGGKEAFVVKYLLNGAIEIGRNGSFNVHDAINLEQDAENKADRIIQKIWNQWSLRPVLIQNQCRYPVRLSLFYLNQFGNWVAEGWWNFNPDQQFFLSVSGTRIATRDSRFDYYAEIPGKGISWGGDKYRKFDGKMLPMRERKFGVDSDGNYKFSIACNNLREVEVSVQPEYDYHAVTKLRSVESTYPSSITFVNSSNKTVDVYWVDFQGNEKPYKKLLPGQSYDQQTYDTHPWVVKYEGSGQLVLTVIGTKTPQVANIK
ncbi:MAG TPA: hypothetical protein VNN20_03460 [Thermodesulfobacteriota bacterium]|nr:hypothetical protein [Thermodesulfobacteriota bacterium]